MIQIASTQRVHCKATNKRPRRPVRVAKWLNAYRGIREDVYNTYADGMKLIQKAGEDDDEDAYDKGARMLCIIDVWVYSTSHIEAYKNEGQLMWDDMIGWNRD